MASTLKSEAVDGSGRTGLFSEAAQFFQSFPWHVEADALRTAHFDDVPFGAGTGFAEVKYFFVKVAIERFLFVFLDVNGPSPPRKFFEHGERIALTNQAVAHIHLHVDGWVGAPEEKLPRKTAIDLL